MNIALCPGSFDPVTVGHIDIIGRAAKLFDKVYVCVMQNAEKHNYFSRAARVELLSAALADYDNVIVDVWDGLCVDYARKIGACAFVKGVRCAEDLAYECAIAAWNREHAPEIETLLLPAKDELSHVSSTRVRELLEAGKPIQNLVPQKIAERIAILKGR